MVGHNQKEGTSPRQQIHYKAGIPPVPNLKIVVFHPGRKQKQRQGQEAERKEQRQDGETARNNRERGRSCELQEGTGQKPLRCPSWSPEPTMPLYQGAQDQVGNITQEDKRPVIAAMATPLQEKAQEAESH